MGTTVKTQKSPKASEKTTLNANEILQIGNALLKTKPRTGATLYRPELFKDCRTDLDKKHLRIKLRRKLHTFLSEFVMKQKNQDELVKLKEAWVSYATQVYNDINLVMDSNATEENQALVTKFIKTMQSV
jgi:hypothetical protein